MGYVISSIARDPPGFHTVTLRAPPVRPLHVARVLSCGGCVRTRDAYGSRVMYISGLFSRLQWGSLGYARRTAGSEPSAAGFVSCVPPAPIVCINFHKPVRLRTHVCSAVLLSVKEPVATRYKEVIVIETICRHAKQGSVQEIQKRSTMLSAYPQCCQEIHSLHFHR